MRKTYEIGGMTFQVRTFTGRDLVRVTGRFSILPLDGGSASSAISSKSNDIADGLLALCSKVPKITLDDPVEIPEGTIPVSEIPDAIYGELITRLCADSGYSAEAAEAVRPTVATSAGS